MPDRPESRKAGRGGFVALADELVARFTAGVDAAWPDFDDVALRVFAVQYEGNPVYRAFCDARGVTPGGVSDWHDLPLVPATAFKHLDLVVGVPDAADRVFRTSGTTRGGERRGRHFVPDVALYRASLLAGARAFLVPEERPLPLLSLIPPPARAPDSSLSYMMGAVADALCSEAVWAVDAHGGPDVTRILEEGRRLRDAGAPVLVAGTAFAFVHLLDELERRGEALTLPHGSRVMETGGFKGRSRTVGRDQLHEGLQRGLGLPPDRIVNEYGMTELLSQLYEPILRPGGSAPRDGSGPGAEGVGHVAPPWLAVRVLDPLTLEDMPEGARGLLAFHDLANLGSVSSILTQDVGSVVDGRLHLAGRHPGAEPRGCSLAVEEMLAATEGRS